MPELVHEHVTVRNDVGVIHGVREALHQSDTPALYTRIRAITADKVTRNYTYYPASELRGDNATYGYITFTHPQPVPILREHRQSDTMLGGYAAEPLGRVIEARLVRSKQGTYVEVLAEITDPYAIEMITSRRYLTVSIGHIPQRVECSICGKDPHGDGCGHVRGVEYETDSGERRLCTYIMRRPQMIELSFVNIPSDNQAGVVSIEEGVAMEHFVQRNGGYYSLNRWKAVESVWTPVEEEMMTDPVETKAVSLGRLYRLAEDDPYYRQTDEDVVEIDGDLYTADEAKLTAAQRKRLPDSAFCGPNRSFPAHDRAHVLAGLRLLGRANLSAAQKARVRACLLRKARQLGMTTGQDDRDSADVLFITESGIRSLPVPFDEELLRQVLSDIGSLMGEFSLSGLRALFVGRLSAEEDNHLFGSSNPPVLAAQVATPVLLPASEDYVRSLLERYAQPESPESQPCDEVTQGEEAQQSAAAEEAVCSGTTEVAEAPAEALAESPAESAEEVIERLLGRRMSVESLIEHYEQQLDSLRAEYDEAVERYRQVLCEYAAFVAVQRSYPAVAGKSLEEAVSVFSHRPESFLQCIIEDLRHARVGTDVVVVTDAKDPRILHEAPPIGKAGDEPAAPEQPVVNDVGIPKGETPSSLGDRFVVEEEDDDIILLSIR